MIARSQKPALFIGFNLMPCSLEMFGKVLTYLFFKEKIVIDFIFLIHIFSYSRHPYLITGYTEAFLCDRIG